MENIKLICLDLDETLIAENSWKKLATSLGISDEEDEKMHRDSKAGKLSYTDWVTKVLGYYMKHENGNRKDMTRILSQYVYSPGAKEIIKYLKDKGYELVIISGAIDILVNIVAKDLDIKYAKSLYASEFDDNDRIINLHTEDDEGKAKLRHLETFCEMLNIDISECAAIGDGDNDIELFRKTGHGITFHGSHIENESWKIIDKLEDLKSLL